MSKILTQAQAEAVYSAMCALTNVGGTVKVTLPIHALPVATSGEYIRAWEDDGHIQVVRCVRHTREADEFYENQAAFATAYDLDQDEALSSYSGMFGTSGNMPKPKL